VAPLFEGLAAFWASWRSTDGLFADFPLSEAVLDAFFDPKVMSLACSNILFFICYGSFIF
jgi:hypothetical protein